MIEIPNVEEKVYRLFSELISLDWMEKDELKEVIDESLRYNNINMGILIDQIIEGIDNGIPMEQQFEIVKILLDKL